MTAAENPSSSSDEDADLGSHYQHKIRFLLRSASALFSTSLVTSGLGFVYWAVAARVFPATEVGESATAISAIWSTKFNKFFTTHRGTARTTMAGNYFNTGFVDKFHKFQ